MALEIEGKLWYNNADSERHRKESRRMAENNQNESCTHDCESCGADCPSRQGTDFRAAANPLSNVKKVIGVVSGKGGVGKSLITSMLAVYSARRGHKTAILDADITGPSIPKIFGVRDEVTGGEQGMLPPASKTGIRMISVNLLLPEETSPVIWRGPGDRRNGKAVLDGRMLGRSGLYVCGYASGNGRRAADGVSVAAAGRHCDRDKPAGAGFHDRLQGDQYGGDDAYSGSRHGGEYELRSLPRLRKGDPSFR